MPRSWLPRLSPYFFAGGSTNGGVALTLNGGELQTFQNGGDDIQGAFIDYQIGSSGFTEFSIFFNSQFPSFGSNTGDKKWQTTGQGIKVLNGLAPGSYNFGVYGRAHGVNGSVNFDLFANNCGANYNATFTVNVSNFTTGQTAVPLVAGSYTAFGTTYNYRSAALTANAVLSAGSKTYAGTLAPSCSRLTSTVPRRPMNIQSAG